MADVLIYTANFGGYDTVRAQVAQDIDVDWLCLTDRPDADAPWPWRTIPVLPTHEHPNLAAKVFKAQPPWELNEWSVAIWIDANMEIMEAAFAREAMAYVNDGLATWAHPRRDCVYDEGTVCLPGAKEGQDGRYENLPIVDQLAAYRDEGFPAHHGLFASGTIVWTPEASSTLGVAWLAEIERWGFQDQLALPVVAWRMGIKPGIFGVHQIERRYSTIQRRTPRAPTRPMYLGNRWLKIHPHTLPPYR